MLQYSKWVDYPTVLIYENKYSSLDFLIDAPTRSLHFTLHKGIKVETDVYYQKAKFATSNMPYVLPPYHSDLE